MFKLLKYLGGSFWRSTSSAEASNKQLIAQSGYFDSDYYAENYGADIASSGVNDPVVHYLRFGGLKGCNPSPKFDSSAYLVAYPEVRAAKFNPLLHYLRHGRYEGRAIHPVIKSAPAPYAPTQEQWEALAKLIESRTFAPPAVDVVVPVFRGVAETANCLYTAIRSKLDCTLSYDLVAVDDASPVAELSSLLDYLSGRGLITVLRNKKNRGFVSSVNMGMKFHSDRDIVLLNSDTEVFGNWLDRLRRAAYSGDDIGTVTPLSNNATICSYPNFPGEFKGALEISFAELDQIAATANNGKTVEIPTAVGFCMYIRRECLQQVGFFDEAAFGLGYGEENDFSLRATRSGWRNVLAGDVFVRHLGRISFLDSTEHRVKQGLDVIKSRFPSYLADIAAYIKSDPPKALRRNIDVARLRRVTGGRVILFTLHNLGGGTAKHVREISKLLEREDVGALWLQPKTDPDHLAVIRHPKVEHLSNGIEIDLKYRLAQAAQLMQDLAVVHIHVHHILGFSSEFVEWVKNVAELCEITYDVTIHDYFLACPQITMIDGSGQYCNNYQLEKCESCIQTHSSPAGRVSVWYWRASHERFLANARRIFVPNESVQRHMAQFFPTLEFSTREHPENPAQCMSAPVVREPGELLRVAVIGAIGAHKGSKVLQQCAQDAAERRLPIEFHLFGYSDIARLRALPNIKLTGEYAEKELPQLLAIGKCHLAFFPAVWPETYSYTLSQAWFAGLYPVAFDLGAIADRIRRNGWGHLLPLEMASDPSSLNDTLLALRPSPLPADFDPVMGSRLYPTIWHDYYGLPGQA